jgi:RNA polymerase-interacting CarD/CdnL/TRCF family regulator
VVHRQPSNEPEFVAEYAREVNEFLRDGGIEMAAFLRALARARRARPRPRTARRPRRG